MMNESDDGDDEGQYAKVSKILTTVVMDTETSSPSPNPF
jgi:hypothetical protein